jgi:hypothetical protein
MREQFPRCLHSTVPSASATSGNAVRRVRTLAGPEGSGEHTVPIIDGVHVTRDPLPHTAGGTAQPPAGPERKSGGARGRGTATASTTTTAGGRPAKPTRQQRRPSQAGRKAHAKTEQTRRPPPPPQTQGQRQRQPAIIQPPGAPSVRPYVPHALLPLSAGN